MSLRSGRRRFGSSFDLERDGAGEAGRGSFAVAAAFEDEALWFVRDLVSS